LKFEFPKIYTEFAKYYERLESQYRNYPQEAKWLNSILDERKAETVIDISCGTGSHVLGLVSEGSMRKVVATDASAQMVRIAETKLPKEKVLLAQADFLSLPFKRYTFDAAICMYWSIAGLNEHLVKDLFSETNSILKKGGTFIFDTENKEGIKENLLNIPYIDAFFPDEKEFVIRANFSTKVAPDLVDWHAYYLIETDGVSQLVNDRMNLRFYGREQLEALLEQTGFSVLEVLSGPYKNYEEHSPSLYFVAEKR
jgi:ubiquinone/menaquinone biosynthesis C-methylase UbiE